MPCDELTIHLFVDGELSPEGERACRSHLLTCVPCREVYRQLLWLDATLRGTEPPVAQIRRRTARPWLFATATAASLMVGWLWSGLSPVVPSSADRAADYRVQLAGASHEISVHGGELLELAVGEEKPESINLERARIR